MSAGIINEHECSMLNECCKVENILENKVDITMYSWTGEYVHVEGKHAVQETFV